MMERRLKLAKDLLNPRDSVLIVTIDEHEYLHLGCLLEEIFRGARIQMISSVIYPIYVNEQTGRISEIGEPLPKNLPISDAPKIEGRIAVFPIRDNGVEIMWGCSAEELRRRPYAKFVIAIGF